MRVFIIFLFFLASPLFAQNDEGEGFIYAVSGEVKNPVVFRSSNSLTLPELIEKAGGFYENSSTRKIRVKEGGKTYQYDFKKDSHRKIKLKSYSLVIVRTKMVNGIPMGRQPSTVAASEDLNNSEKKNIKVYVSGEVEKPMAVIVPRKTTLKAIIEHVGGGKELAALDRVILMRRGQAWKYDLRKEAHQKIKLEPFDLVFIPQKEAVGR